MECGAFGFARGKEPGACAGEGWVVIAGVGNEFVHGLWLAWGDGGEQGSDGGGIECSGSEDAQRSAGGGESVFRDEVVKAGSEQVKEADLGTAGEWRARGGVNTPRRLEGIANSADAAGVRGAKNGAEHAREHVGVLVRVDVGEGDAAGLQELNLGARFGFDFAGLNFAANEALEKAFEGGVKAAGFLFGEGGKSGEIVHGIAIDEDDVAADSQGRRGMSDSDGLLGGSGASHERGAGEDALPVQFKDGTVDTGGEAKVVGVYDEAGHWLV